NGLTWVDP
ncbi:MAG: hypothetical protein J6581_10060, partial [Apibacter sp.]|nr:hypothetical protein [Apibacter sp.]